ncbi:hypothetical protein HK105_205244 [Polyrhizophydium stewartii]|uniref:chitin synthase n=1 Tax=Polyrhizophydium stewartii TaxID=2732419 RepID=A0ABR4N6N5_9FUNG
MRPGRKNNAKRTTLADTSPLNIHDLSLFRLPYFDTGAKQTQDVDTITRILAERLQRGRLIYTWIGDRAMVSVRPANPDHLAQTATFPGLAAPPRSGSSAAVQAALAGAGGAAAAEAVPVDVMSKDRAVRLRSMGPLLASRQAPAAQATPQSGNVTLAVHGSGEPHLFDIVGSAYVHLVNDHRDQCILLSGESNSGKSESGRLIARHLVDLTRTPPSAKKSKLQSAAMKLDFVLSAFGNASTASNMQASHFGRYTEYQFDDSGAFVGLKLLAYNLEKHRVTDASDMHANFNVFYYLLAGCDAKTRAALSLTDASSHFALLNRVSSKPSASGSPALLSPVHHFDPDHYERLVEHLKAVGIPKKTQNDLFQVLAGVLHLGNIQFARASDAGANDPCTVKSAAHQHHLDTAASLLGLKPDHLLSALTYETRAIGRELCTVILDAAGAARQRNSLAQLLYSLLFQWVIEAINTRFCKDDAEWANYISVVDFPGIAASSPASANAVSRIVANYAVERVQGFAIASMADTLDRLVADRAVPPASNPHAVLAKNDAVLRLLAAPTTGVISILLQDAARRDVQPGPASAANLPSSGGSGNMSFSTGTLHASGQHTDVLDRIARFCGDDPKILLMHTSHAPTTSSTTSSARRQFGVYHYTGLVHYDVAAVTDASASTSISTDFLSLFCGSMDQPATRMAFVRQLFSKRAIAVDMHPKNRLTLLRARQSMVPTRRPSTIRRRATARATILAHGPSAAAAAAGAGAAQGDASIVADASAILNESHTATAQRSGSPALEPGRPASTGGGLAAAAAADADACSLLAQTKTSMDELFESLADAQPWFVMHVRPNASARSAAADVAEIGRQVKALQLDAVANSVGMLHVQPLAFETLLSRALDVLDVLDGGLGPAARAPHDQGLIARLRAAERAGFSSLPAADLAELAGEVLDELGIETDMYLVGQRAVFPTELGARTIYARLNADRLVQGLSIPQAAEPPAHAGASSHTAAAPSLVGASDCEPDAEADDAEPTARLIPAGGRQARAIPRVMSMTQSVASGYTGEDDALEGGSMYDFTAHYDRGDAASVSRSPTLGRRTNDVETGTAPPSPVGPAAPPARTPPPPEPKRKLTPARRWWLCCTWSLTWWLPTPIIACMCGKRRPDVQIAWREKLALCIIIFLMCASMLFLIVGLGRVLCPKQNVLSEGEVSTHNTLSDPLVIAYGRYYAVGDVLKTHVQGSAPVIGAAAMVSTVLGRDVSAMFYPTLLPQTYCPNMRLPPGWDNVYQRSSQGTQQTWYPHQYAPQTGNKARDYLGEMARMRRGYVARSSDWIASFLAADSGHKVIVAWGNVYDISAYYDPSNVGATDTSPGFFGPLVKQVFDAFVLPANAGRDATSTLNQLRQPQFGGAEALASVRACMDGLFLAGVVDTRNELRCVLPNYIMLAASVVLVMVIGFKFVGALQFGASTSPEKHTKFVICQVPCYTEDEESLRKTIDSIACADYDDKRKLLFIICDGMIIGAGNDRPTPRIVLDILGVDPDVDPDSQSFQSLGPGARQHNMGKVFSGLYAIEGRFVPFIVVVKVGSPSERHRPGNRGKRDSQLVLMRFLNRVHFNAPMAPLELDIFHHMKNVIGVHPALYEYVLMVDADTEILPSSLNLLVSSMVRDARIMGICGETQLANEQQSLVTMMQVYEYYISHHLAKAFESLFGTVTCLPGCFCMYRIRMPTGRNTPLLVAPGVLADYSNNSVDTLHLKNLLELGEDRYLTTLMLRHFPTHKTKFVQGAICRTGAPEKWSVFLSQRRRWINSTVHNLFELLFLSEMCGVCCFSMRFVVFIDLFATFLQPSSLIYIIYLVYSAASDPTMVFPMISLVMLAAIYGLQMLIFLLKQEWQHIGWMIIYLLAMPLFGFYVPLYSFWHFDDFSWGNTRVVLGESGKSGQPGGGHGGAGDAADRFDPASIPLVSWSDHEEKTSGSRSHLGDAESEKQPAFYEPSLPSLPSLPRPPPPAAVPATAPSPYAFADADAVDDMPVGATPAAIAAAAFSPSPPRYGVPQRMHLGHHHAALNHHAQRRASVASQQAALTRHQHHASQASTHLSSISSQSSGAALIYPPHPHPSLMAQQPATAAQQPAASTQQQQHHHHQQQPPTPSLEDRICQKVSHILHTADLSNMTKRQLRETVAAELDIDPTRFKQAIDDCIRREVHRASVLQRR